MLTSSQQSAGAAGREPPINAFELLRAVLPALLAAAAAVAVLAGGVGPWGAAAAALAVAGAALAVSAGLRQAALHARLSALLSPDERAGRPGAPAMVDRLALRLSAVEHRAAVHATTGLPTREPLLRAMGADMRAGEGACVLGLLHLCDFDQLLAFDDAAARGALVELADRISRAVSRAHFVGHVDRATFAVWFRTGEAAGEFDALAYVAGQQIALPGRVLAPVLVCATAAFPADGSGAEQLLAKAVASLPRAAGEGGRVGIQAPAEVRERFRLEQDLAHAIEREELSLAFQPVVDLARGRLAGAEALLRWAHPELGNVSPARFIPMVEQLGLSDRYGLWVLNAACREAARWRAQGLGDLRMSVNLSAKQVGDAQLEAKIDRTLARHALDSRAVELELTETAAMADARRTLELFTRLRAKGLGLAIDDFGAGYSSLSYLKNLPFTKLKIDREFVTDVDTRTGSRAICKALIELGRGLDLVVLAEGVETAAEVDTLRRLGCTVFQGFHFSRPLPGDAFVDYARTEAWRALAAGPFDPRPLPSPHPA